VKNIGIILAALVFLSGAGEAFAKPETGIKIAEVPATVRRIDLKIRDRELMAELKSAEGAFSYEISFGKLTEAQFKRLTDYFKKSEPLAFDARKSYGLADFLPAKMQALLHKRLENKVRKSADLDNVELFYKNYGEVYSTINCWGTAWEMVRDPSAGTPLVAFMSGRRYTQLIIQSASDLVKPQDGRFGDMLLLLTSDGDEKKMQHAAVYIGYGYYFERTDSGSAMFFRIAHLDDMRNRLKKAFQEKAAENEKSLRINIELRRFRTPPLDPRAQFSAAKAEDPSVTEYADALPNSEDKRMVTLFSDDRMGGGDEVTLTDIAVFDIRLDPSTGRGGIDPATKDAARFKNAD
jgi:hypothetical protein